MPCNILDLCVMKTNQSIIATLNRESRGYRERGGIKAKRAGSGGEGLGLIPTEGYFKALELYFYLINILFFLNYAKYRSYEPLTRDP